MTDHRDEELDKPKVDDDELETDRPSGWAGVDDALGGTGNRPAGPDYGASPPDEEKPEEPADS